MKVWIHQEEYWPVYDEVSREDDAYYVAHPQHYRKIELTDEEYARWATADNEWNAVQDMLAGRWDTPMGDAIGSVEVAG